MDQPHERQKHRGMPTSKSTVGEFYFAKDSIESGISFYLQSQYMPMGVTSYWSLYKVSHVTGYCLNYLILNSKALFADDTLD